LSQIPNPVICHAFSRRPFSFSVLTVQAIFTEMDVRMFPGPSLDD
jgi:hypothetical protein